MSARLRPWASAIDALSEAGAWERAMRRAMPTHAADVAPVLMVAAAEMVGWYAGRAFAAREWAQDEIDAARGMRERRAA